MSEPGITLDPETARSARHLANAKERSLEWIIREAVALYAASERHRAESREIARDRWSQFEVDGLYVPAERADAWLAALESGDEPIDPPISRD